MTNETKIKEAKKLINEIFGNTEVDTSQTADDLRELKDEIESLLDTL